MVSLSCISFLKTFVIQLNLADEQVFFVVCNPSLEMASIILIPVFSRVYPHFLVPLN